MKKTFLFIVLSYILTIPSAALASGGIVQCDGSASNPCDITAFFKMLGAIYSFLVLTIATPLAVIGVAVGGIMMMISAGNPTLMGNGKKVLYASIIGLVLALCSYLIIKFILSAIGYTGSF